MKSKIIILKGKMRKITKKNIFNFCHFNCFLLYKFMKVYINWEINFRLKLSLADYKNDCNNGVEKGIKLNWFFVAFIF